ncbi:hypothetical protein O1D97_02215 [Marinomonas sp. 15G1-11]|uniref:Secreted protein n=1 Tax=Marinomonas phaeophyticola TaxID=3004091 RepID=A0ABT4JQ48_9GAMM|nr:hypothetical protein [Marinomonas sp. 15G1-11]MCZ2720489.1 hypothetical protein [Marinomonas sp. 15G1-11]
MFKMMFLFLSVLLSFSTFAGGIKSTLSRESIGDIEGILKDERTWSAPEFVAEQSYRPKVDQPLSLGVFDVKRPLPIQLTFLKKEDVGTANCRAYFLDKNFSVKEAKLFFDQHAGSKLKLLNGQLVKLKSTGGSARWCKFTDYKVLASQKELEQERQNRIAEFNSYQFEGTIKVFVARLYPSRMIMFNLTAGDITQKSLFERCDKTLTIDPPLTKSQIRATDYRKKEATVNLKIEGRKCVAKSVVFDA